MHSAAAARLAYRLDRAVLRARINVLLRLVGIGCGAAAVVATVAAGLDCWLKPTGFWLGGSLVWAATVGSALWSIQLRAGGHEGQPWRTAWWPTRFAVARHWEQALQFGGSPISAAVGFLDAAGRPAATAALSADDFAALAIQRADQAAAELPVEPWPATGLAMTLLGPAVMAGLLVSAWLGPTDWQTALARQLPPAVGGWPTQPAPPVAATPTLTPLSPPEIAAATRRLIARLAACDQAAGTTRFESALRGVTGEARQLAARLPDDATAGIIRWTAQRLPGVVLRADRVAALERMVAAGNAAEELAVAVAVQQQLVDQLARLLARQPGLFPEELPPSAQRRLAALAAAQQSLDESTATAIAMLQDAGLPLPAVAPSSAPPELIERNRLALAATQASRSARGLAEAVAPLGLDIPERVSTAGGTMSDSLTLAVVELTAVSRELDREAQDLAAVPQAATGVMAGARPSAAVGDTIRGVAAGESSASGLPGAAGGSAGGGETVTAPVSAAGLAAGPSWRLTSPGRLAVGRVATDRTLPPATAAAFDDYLGRLVSPPTAPKNSSDRAGP